MTEAELAVARRVKGFMPEDEGLALHEAGLAGGEVGPLLEIGSYCGKSAVFLGSAARARGTVLYTIDHHRGSEENQAGWEHHDPEVVDPATGRMDTLPYFRRTIEAAALEGAVVAVIGDSPTVGAHWATPVGTSVQSSRAPAPRCRRGKQCGPQSGCRGPRSPERRRPGPGWR